MRPRVERAMAVSRSCSSAKPIVFIPFFQVLTLSKINRNALIYHAATRLPTIRCNTIPQKLLSTQNFIQPVYKRPVDEAGCNLLFDSACQYPGYASGGQSQDQKQSLTKPAENGGG